MSHGAVKTPDGTSEENSSVNEEEPVGRCVCLHTCHDWLDLQASSFFFFFFFFIPFTQTFFPRRHTKEVSCVNQIDSRFVRRCVLLCVKSCPAGTRLVF